MPEPGSAPPPPPPTDPPPPPPTQPVPGSVRQHRHTCAALPGWVPRSAPSAPVLSALAGPGTAEGAFGDVTDPGSTEIPSPGRAGHPLDRALADAGATTGAVTVLPLDGPAGGDPAPAATAGADGSRTARRRATPGERGVVVLSAVLGSAGLLLGVVLALLHAYAYDMTVACTAYAKAHAGSAGFGCSPGAKTTAIALPAIGLPVLVVAALALVWIPEHSARRRLLLLGGLLLLLLAAAGAAAAAYSAVPLTS